VEVGLEGVPDAKKRVDPRRPPAALEAGDRRLGGAHELGEIGLREPALLPAIGDLSRDLREQPALLRAGEPRTNSLYGLTHISIMLYIAIVRYKWSIAGAAAYAMLFEAFVIYVWLLDGDWVASAALLGVALMQVVAGFLLGWRALFLLPLLVLLSIPVPVPEDAYEPMPMWFAMLYLGIPIAAVLMAVGIVARSLWSSWRSHSVA
jgi:hypothetical protein